MDKMNNNEGTNNQDIERESVKHVLQIMGEEFGFPKWPPEEEPEVAKDWYKNEMMVYPNKNVFKNMGAVRTIEFTASPSFGKSTLLRESLEPQVTRFFQEQGDGRELVVVDDMYIVNTPNAYYIPTEIIMSRPARPELNDDEELPSIFTKGEEDWMENLLMQRMKSMLMRNLFKNQEEEAYTRRKTKYIVLTRGPLDALVWLMALSTHKEDEAFVTPDYVREDVLLNFEYELVHNFSLLVNRCGVVVVGGISQEEAQRRSMGKSKNVEKGEPGYVARSPFYQSLAHWQGYLAKELLPQLHKKLGIGYMVVDGEKPKEEVKKQVTDYVLGVVDPASRGK